MGTPPIFWLFSLGEPTVLVVGMLGFAGFSGSGSVCDGKSLLESRSRSICETRVDYLCNAVTKRVTSAGLGVHVLDHVGVQVIVGMAAERLFFGARGAVPSTGSLGQMYFVLGNQCWVAVSEGMAWPANDHGVV